MCRVGLAAKLGDLAMALQDNQDQAANMDDDFDDVNDEWPREEALVSQDMFDASQEEVGGRAANPLLAARAKREELLPRPAITSQRQEARNPFARRSGAAAQSSSPANSSGLAFDTAVPVRPSPLPSKSSLTASFNKPKVP